MGGQWSEYEPHILPDMGSHIYELKGVQAHTLLDEFLLEGFDFWDRHDGVVEPLRCAFASLRHIMGGKGRRALRWPTAALRIDAGANG
jgi:hypothetical protein